MITVQLSAFLCGTKEGLFAGAEAVSSQPKPWSLFFKVHSPLGLENCSFCLGFVSERGGGVGVVRVCLDVLLSEDEKSPREAVCLMLWKGTW